MEIIKKINMIVTVASIAVSAFEFMHKTFKWYEKKHGKKDNKNITHPIIKGI